MLFILAFLSHPHILRPRIVKSALDVMARIRNRKLLHAGHILMIVSVPMLILTAIRMLGLALAGPFSGLALAGCVLAVLGSIVLAVDKGALCLTVSAFDTLSDSEFQPMEPGFRVLFQKASWMKLVWGIVLLPAGFLLLTVSLWMGRTLPAWECVPLITGSLLLLMPDGIEIVNLVASVLLAVSLIPMGIHWIAS
jgi:hypothetical protein